MKICEHLSFKYYSDIKMLQSLLKDFGLTICSCFILQFDNYRATPATVAMYIILKI